MCYNCWIEAGSPAAVNERITEAARLVDELYQQEGCAVGGYAHVVVDDWNLDSGCIESCIRDAEMGDFDWVSEAGRQASLKALNALLVLGEDEAYAAMALHSGFLTQA